MSDGAVTAVVTGAVSIVTMLVGFLTLWVKLKYSAEKAEEAATKVAAVETKIDDNTALTKTAAASASTAADKAGVAAERATESNSEKMEVLHKIEKQTNGSADALRQLVQAMAERVMKLEEYNRDGTHRVIDAINAVHLKVTELAAVQKLMAPVPATTQPQVSSPAELRKNHP